MSTTGNTVIGQQLFSFNLIEYVKRKYGFTPDVAWLKANVTKLTANWWGFGSNAQANPSGIANFAGKVAGQLRRMRTSRKVKFREQPQALWFRVQE
jgi:hypothetical protein